MKCVHCYPTRLCHGRAFLCSSGALVLVSDGPEDFRFPPFCSCLGPRLHIRVETTDGVPRNFDGTSDEERLC